MGIKNLSLWQKISFFDKKNFNTFYTLSKLFGFYYSFVVFAAEIRKTPGSLFKKTVFKDENIGIYLVQTFTGYNRASYISQESSFTL